MAWRKPFHVCGVCGKKGLYYLNMPSYSLYHLRCRACGQDRYIEADSLAEAFTRFGERTAPAERAG